MKINYVLIILLALASTLTAGAAPATKAAKRDIAKEIRAEAAIEWPGNYQMQEYHIKEERKAFNKIVVFLKTHKGNHEAVNILSNAKAKWPKNYRMMMYQTNTQWEAYLRLNIASL